MLAVSCFPGISPAIYPADQNFTLDTAGCLVVFFVLAFVELRLSLFVYLLIVLGIFLSLILIMIRCGIQIIQSGVRLTR